MSITSNVHDVKVRDVTVEAVQHPHFGYVTLSAGGYEVTYFVQSSTGADELKTALILGLQNAVTHTPE